MKDKIVDALKELEKDRNITILYACESGSRAWGFPSTDSDYDVRFFYVHEYNWYLSIDNHRDVIENVGKVLDFSGWELKKTLRLFRGSNASLYEKLQSPMVYMERGDFRKNLDTLMDDFYSPVSGIHHYLSLSRNFLDKELSVNNPKLKKYFYAVRSVLAAKWIREVNTVPPMTFSALRELMSHKEWNSIIDHWLEAKLAGTESLTVERSSVINDFLLKEIEEGLLYAQKIKGVKNSDSDKLNLIFRKLVNNDLT